MKQAYLVTINGRNYVQQNNAEPIYAAILRDHRFGGYRETEIHIHARYVKYEGTLKALRQRVGDPGPGPKYKECPECQTKSYHAKDDFICVACRRAQLAQIDV